MLRFLTCAESFFGPLRVFESITVRAAVAVVLAFLLTLLLGPAFIRRMTKRNATEDVSKPDAERLEKLHQSKSGTPTMGGLFLAASVALTALLCCDMGNPLVWTALVSDFVDLGALPSLPHDCV